MYPLVENIQHFLTTNRLPGYQAQSKMSPFQLDKAPKVSQTATDAAVLFLIYPNDDNELTTAYMLRTSHFGADRHKGQISLPGGKFDPEDLSFKHCALRETEEEFGIPKESIKILGSLTSLFVFVSDFLIHPFIGFIDHKPDFKPDKTEVEQIIEITLSQLFHEKTKKFRAQSFGSTRIKKSPYYQIQNQILWGATAMITSEIEHIYIKM